MPAIEHDPLAKLREWVHNGKLRWEAHRAEPGKVGFQYTGDANDAPEGLFTDEHGYVATANANQWMNHLNDNLAEPEDRETPAAPVNPPIESAENEGQPNIPTLPEGATESTSPVQSQSPAPAPAPPVVEPSPPSAPAEPTTGPESPALEDTASAEPGIDVPPVQDDLLPGQPAPDTNS